MLNSAATARMSTIVPSPVVPSQGQCQQNVTSSVPSVPSYTIGPIDPAHLLTLSAHLSNGEICPLLVLKPLPLWILHHPEFRDGYERNYFHEEREDNQQWGTVPHMVNLIYSKVLGEGFEDLSSGEVAPDFGAWEIGWLLRDFTRLAEADRMLALTGMAHLCFLVSFLPREPPASWPPASLLRAWWQHNDAVKAYRARVRLYREQGKSYNEAQRLALN
ncbi:MAG: hypothetical protein H0U76_01640 [Ktedonobacteraceae bacterium]|nr:hypothetical protein [Ktedonobacteraceae bacterium]